MTTPPVGPPDDDDFLEELGRALGHEPSREPSPDRVAAVRAAAERLSRRPDLGPGGRSPRRLLLTGGIAAGVGGIAGYLANDLTTSQPEPSAGPPVESLSLVADAGVTATGGLINHTWGTELLLDVTGLDAGAAYAVDYGLLDGTTVSAGSLLGVADVVMRCRFNAAAVRAELARIVVRDAAGGPVVSVDLPPSSTAEG
jgi:hypothetical protein